MISQSQIDLVNVPEDRVPVYKAGKVAFRCPQCLVPWDKLSDTEKDAKLAKVMRRKGS